MPPKVIILDANLLLFWRSASPRRHTFPSINDFKAMKSRTWGELELWSRTHGTAEVQAIFDRHGVPSSPYRTVKEAMADPQLVHRQSLAEIANAGGRFLALNPPFRLSAARTAAQPFAAALGEHTAEVLSELGYTEAEIAALRGEAWWSDRNRCFPALRGSPDFPVRREKTGKKPGLAPDPRQNIIFDQSLARPIPWAAIREIIRRNREFKSVDQGNNREPRTRSALTSAKCRHRPHADQHHRDRSGQKYGGDHRPRISPTRQNLRFEAGEIPGRNSAKRASRSPDLIRGSASAALEMTAWLYRSGKRRGTGEPSSSRSASATRAGNSGSRRWHGPLISDRYWVI
jgi:hypothetical protein